MIRASQPADRDRLYAIWHAAVAATHDFLSAADFDQIAQIVRDDYIPAAPFLVALNESGHVAGFMGMTGHHIDALFIDPTHHGAGHGRALVEHGAAAFDAVTVDVNEQNVGAAAFYRRLGFDIVGRSDTDDAGRPYPLLHLRRAKA